MTNIGTVLLVDADIIAYQSAVTSDGKRYNVNGVLFKYKKEAVEECASLGIDESSITVEFHPDPESYAIHNVRLSLESLQSKYPGATMECFLTGSLNFRTEVDPMYKGLRTTTPVHLASCKQYIVNKWGGTKTEGLEADDLIGIRATELETAGVGYVICTLDKDLDMITGYHYNWRKDLEYMVLPTMANQAFYRQLLTGDTTDGIPGIYGIGPKKAKDIIPDDLWHNNQMYQAVLEEYLVDAGYCRTLEETKALIKQRATLLWIQREEWVTWSEPT